MALSNFLTEIIEADLAAGRHTRVVTRFPPEPNGFLHIGHAKSICLNFGLAAQYGGVCHLRFDDTNPVTEESRYVEAIQEDVRWLGFDWGKNLFFASDYFEFFYACALRLVRDGKAYVCSSSEEEIRAHRGSLTEPGQPSPYRERSVDENLELLERMRQGEFLDGAHVLRARIDMASPNMKMRDPLIYRIRHAHHHRTGDAWCIYPLYDFAHCLSDAKEGITHSICTLEFENNRELYDWFIEHTGVACRPRQYEFARLALGYTMMSKRKLLQLVREGTVAGWDDPRMPTIAALRRRGVTSEAIRGFADLVGVAKANSQVDIDKLEFCLREDLNLRAPRVMAVLDPLKVVITNYPEGAEETFDAPLWPSDIGREGSRPVPFGREVYIERTDFADPPPKGWHRLAPGAEVRLRYAYVIRCEEVIRNRAGEVVELRATHDPATRGGSNPAGRKIKGTLHWVSASRAVPCEVRLYDRLFTAERPDAEEGDWQRALNPQSLVTRPKALLEPSVADSRPGARVQLERHGYFMTDPVDSRPGHLVWNRTVALRDSWAKQAEALRPELPASKAEPAPPREDTRPEKRSRSEGRAIARSRDPELAARFERYQAALGLAENEADLLTGDRETGALFEAALAAHPNPGSVAVWVTNELGRVRKERGLDALRFGGRELGEVVALVDAGTISASAAKEVLAELAERGGSPAAIVAARGLGKETDAAALGEVVRAVVAAHPDEVGRYRAGKHGLMGFFVGAVMRGSGGRADAAVVRELLGRQLEGMPTDGS
jgi:glutaminyl-tRNA synthetase